MNPIQVAMCFGQKIVFYAGYYNIPSLKLFGFEGEQAAISACSQRISDIAKGLVRL